MSDDDRAATHLSRLGVNPVTIARLRQFAETDEMTLRDFVRFVLSDYAPPAEILYEGTKYCDQIEEARRKAFGLPALRTDAAG